MDRAGRGALIGGGVIIREAILGTYMNSDGQNSEVMERDIRRILIRKYGRLETLLSGNPLWWE